MDPINQKERTTSFLQFMLLFLVTIIFVNIGVFFNTRFFKKDYQVLKESLQKLEASNQNLPNLVALLDSTQQNIKKLDITNAADFEMVKTTVFDKYLDRLESRSTDSTDFDQLNSRIKSICIDWINDRRKLLQISDLYKDNAKKEKRINNLETILIQKGVSEDVLKTLGE